MIIILNQLKTLFNKLIFGIIFILPVLSGCIKDGGDDTPTDPLNEQNTSKNTHNNSKQNNNPSLSACLVAGTDSCFEVATWNIKNYPLTNETKDYVQRIVEESKVDLFALQEIKKKADFDFLVSQIVDYKGVIYVQTALNLAFMYNKNVVELTKPPYAILKGDTYAFPRAPYVIEVRHKKSGIAAILVNIHLKCCSGGENEERRLEASKKLKKWVDTNHPDDRVIILGDFNDEIAFDSYNVFQNFIDDTTNYSFIDMGIAMNTGKAEWSYPSYPSHIDHVLITDELFNNFSKVNTFTIKNCDARYLTKVSDHLPVVAVFK